MSKGARVVSLFRPIYSDGSRLFVQFVSDLSLTADGFICHYAFKLKNSTLTGSLVPVTAAAPTTAGPIGLSCSLLPLPES